MTTDQQYDGWIPVTSHLPDINSPPDRKEIENWRLVLSARRIPVRAIPQRNPRELLVPEKLLAVACDEISLYRQENPVRIPVKTERRLTLSDNALTSLCVLFLIGIFHNLTYFQISGFGHAVIDWLQLGSADNSKILAGEWWRCATALTLHADGQHLLGNILIGGYFVARLCQITGSGLGWLLILASGISGNLINALFQSPGHNAVGASTAIFGAIGIAGAFGAVYAEKKSIRYIILPLAAAGTLLTFLGAGTTDGRTDVAAHIFGFICGILIGFPGGMMLKRKGAPKGMRNIAYGCIAVCIVLGSWLLALLN